MKGNWINNKQVVTSSIRHFLYDSCHFLFISEVLLHFLKMETKKYSQWLTTLNTRFHYWDKEFLEKLRPSPMHEETIRPRSVSRRLYLARICGKPSQYFRAMPVWETAWIWAQRLDVVLDDWQKACDFLGFIFKFSFCFERESEWIRMPLSWIASNLNWMKVVLQTYLCFCLAMKLKIIWSTLTFASPVICRVERYFWTHLNWL